MQLKEQQQQHHHQQLNRHRHPPVYTPSPSTNDFSKQYAHMVSRICIHDAIIQKFTSCCTFRNKIQKSEEMRLRFILAT